jgi:hypothetical protein
MSYSQVMAAKIGCFFRVLTLTFCLFITRKMDESILMAVLAHQFRQDGNTWHAWAVADTRDEARAWINQWFDDNNVPATERSTADGTEDHGQYKGYPKVDGWYYREPTKSVQDSTLAGVLGGLGLPFRIKSKT